MRVILSPPAKQQFNKLDKPIQERISKYLLKVAKLENPRSFGRALKGSLGDFWRYRVGDYRIICHIHDDILQIEVVRVGHRRDVYASYPQ